VIKTLCPIFSGWRAAWIKGMSSGIFSLSFCLSEKKTQLFRVEKCCEKRGAKRYFFHNRSNGNIFIVAEPAEHCTMYKHSHIILYVVYVSLCDFNPLS